SLRDDHHSRKLDIAVPGGQRHLDHLKPRIRVGAEGLLIHVDRIDRKIERAFAYAFITLTEIRDSARRARFLLRALHSLDDCDSESPHPLPAKSLRSAFVSRARA